MRDSLFAQQKSMTEECTCLELLRQSTKKHRSSIETVGVLSRKQRRFGLGHSLRASNEAIQPKARNAELKIQTSRNQGRL
jgi:hypothetical protein